MAKLVAATTNQDGESVMPPWVQLPEPDNAYIVLELNPQNGHTLLWTQGASPAAILDMLQTAASIVVESQVRVDEVPRAPKTNDFTAREKPDVQPG